MAQRGGLAPYEIAPVVNVLFSSLGAGRFGQASSVGWILFVITMGASLIQFKLINRLNKE
jgi:ABC-type sugar transport system permease subunit